MLLLIRWVWIHSNPDGPKPTQHINLAQPTYPSLLPCLSHGPNQTERAQPKARARVSWQGHTAVVIFDWRSDLVQLWHACMLHQFLVQTRSLIYWVCTREFVLESPRQEQDREGEITFHLSSYSQSVAKWLKMGARPLALTYKHLAKCMPLDHTTSHSVSWITSEKVER